MSRTHQASQAAPAASPTIGSAASATEVIAKTATQCRARAGV
ncbi:Uncharacterised protein [Mycobacteroides abscessus subsp. abscessus]|nr:Uncharacterised protein [Mycobacteroides abscessus subsp. abscessus]